MRKANEHFKRSSTRVICLNGPTMWHDVPSITDFKDVDIVINRSGGVNNVICLGGSHGLVVMGDNSCSRGCWFESQRCILDGHFSHSFVVKIVLFV